MPRSFERSCLCSDPDTIHRPGFFLPIAKVNTQGASMINIGLLACAALLWECTASAGAPATPRYFAAERGSASQGEKRVTGDKTRKRPWDIFAPFFQPPSEFAGQFGAYR